MTNGSVENISRTRHLSFRHTEAATHRCAWKRCSNNMQQITEEHPCWSAISIKLQSNFIEIRLRHGCSPVDLLYIFRAPFLKNTSARLLLDIGLKNAVPKNVAPFAKNKGLTASSAQNMKFSIKDFFSKCDQIWRKLRIWSHLLKKFLMENFIFCAAQSKNQQGFFILRSLNSPLDVINLISPLVVSQSYDPKRVT